MHHPCVGPSPKTKLGDAMFKPDKTIIGMIHTRALPGTPRAAVPVQSLIDHAVAEARTYQDAGIHALAIENMHDIPYLNRNVGPEVVASMTAIALAVKAAVSLPVGIQILAGANQAALAVALAANLDFIRAEGFVFAHVADEGLMQSDAGELLRYRRQIGAEHIPIFCDIKKKHSSHTITDDVSIEETAHAAEFFLADGLIITGTATGQEADLKELKRVKERVSLPVMVGSGIKATNISDYLAVADGVIVGSDVKQGGHWSNPIDPARVRALVQAAAPIYAQKSQQNP